MSDPSQPTTNRAVDDEAAVVQHGSDPMASYPAGTDPVDPSLEESGDADDDQ